MASMSVHYTLSGGWWPTVGTHYRKPADWLPEVAAPVRRPRRPPLARAARTGAASDRLLQACCDATGCKPSEWVDEEHELVQWGMPRLLTTFLDSPDFLSR